MNFTITKERVIHLLRHFESIDSKCQLQLIENGYLIEQINKDLKSSGSLFLSSFCTSPCELPSVLTRSNPEILHIQENGLYVIKFHSNGFLGTNGLIPVSRLSRQDQDRILFQDRNGIKVRTINHFKAPKTKEGHVIAKNSSNGKDFEIVTCFPGDLSPAFPDFITNSEERAISQKFWNEHILITNS